MSFFSDTSSAGEDILSSSPSSFGFIPGAPGSPTLAELLGMFPEPPPSPLLSPLTRERGTSEGRKSPSVDEDKSSILNKIKGRKKSLFGSTDRMPTETRKTSSPKSVREKDSTGNRGSVETLFRDVTLDEDSNRMSRSTDDVRSSDYRSPRSGSINGTISPFSLDSSGERPSSPEEEARSPGGRRNRSSMFINGEQLTQLNVEMGVQQIEDQINDLLVRSLLGATITPKEHQEVFMILRDMDSNSFNASIEKAHKTVETLTANPQKKDSKGKSFFMKGSKEKNPAVKLSKSVVLFEKHLVVHQPSSLDLCITSIGNAKAKYKFCPNPSTRNYEIQFDPKEGVIKKKAFQNVWVTVTVKGSADISHVCYLEIENGARHYFLVRGQSEPFVFGAPVTSLDWSTDAGLAVPTVLGTMRNYLVNNGGLIAESVFRIPSDDREEKVVKAELNSGKFVSCRDVYVVANLLKNWFRDLPESIVEGIKFTAEQSESVEESRKIVQAMPEPKRTLLIWLINLLVDVAAESKSNRMNSKNLGLVWSGVILSSDHPKVSPETFALASKLPTFLTSTIDGGKMETP
eukprot:TRINITY_DN4498_c0_g1_i3.p1 TRINITY_DN4498_c0_g1~~TRINITY_DN4498_c0_g1_i3.p1  ORF type:complete len:574 (-),score=204.54 TRINITY_DN4498_c0_g1_i3:119-1840(-)